MSESKESKKQSNAIRCIKCRSLHIGVILTIVPIIVITGMIFGIIQFTTDDYVNMVRFGIGVVIETFLIILFIYFLRAFCDPEKEEGRDGDFGRNGNLFAFLALGLVAFILGMLLIFSTAEEISGWYLQSIFDNEGREQMIIMTENIPCIIWDYSSTWSWHNQFEPMSLSEKSQTYAIDDAFELRC